MIAAEGEQRASRSLKEAAEVIADTPSALQLRYLQTLASIAAEKNSTIVFPIPMELFSGFIAHDQRHEPHNNDGGRSCAREDLEDTIISWVSRQTSASSPYAMSMRRPPNNSRLPQHC